MRRDLGALFNPRTLAIVGASADPAKWGHWLARGALAGAHRRSVYLVNRRGGEVLGQAAYRSLGDLPESPELVVIAVPASAFEEQVEAALALGAKALIGITAGLGETGAEGKTRERALRERVRAGGAVLLGPNCLGVFDAESELQLTSNPLPPGQIGLVSQSGNLALEVGMLAAEVGLGISRFVSLGNQADLDAAEILASFAEHARTRVVAVYCEDFRDGRAFARAAAEVGRPVVLLSAGGTSVGARAARSHTGAIVSSDVAVEAACRAAGIVRARTPAELVDLAQALLAPARPRGGRVAVVGDGGGHGVVAADLAVRDGLDLPRLSDELAREIAAGLPETAATGNPIDLAGGGEQDVGSFGRVVSLLLASAEVDSVLLTGYFGGYGEYAAELRRRELEVAEDLVQAVARCGRPLLVHTMYWRSPPAAALRSGGVPVYRTIEAAVGALARLVEQSRVPAQLRMVAELPPAQSAEGLVADYFGARALVASAGIPLVEARRVRSLAEARAAARDLGYPVVLKAADLLHKSDQGGVAVGLGDEAELEAAFRRMASLGEELSVEQMAPVAEGVELLVGVRRDPRFGPVLLVGLGGIYAEIVRDVAAALAPVGEEAAEALLRSLRAAPLLVGARGRPPADLHAAARAASRLASLVSRHPRILEMEINPLLVLPQGALALDARLVLIQEGEEECDPVEVT